ncbi:flagellar basal-body MS-ring/collar protein FliF [Buchnera aphidicola]|uniref:Flagellar M-ring protein n=1 Tax=Buchnera aphidicola (Macrosiphum gaurae) TaxID=2315801 RepID=A0A4D6YDC1_9GAMM|nr:flagellar basal-body MS-ring/collar protein FliF [Buchnera aphidicola]QCI22535.1 flagellar basal body M-ring protein FliF [Buchnera aphidicola (Macrosiphum gaurae)]
MNFSTIEDAVLKEKKKFNNFLPHFLKNSRVLIILLTAAVVTAVSVSIWIKSPEYQVLYNHLSNEDGGAIINELNQMKIPYQFTDLSGQISVPKDKVYEIRLRLAENNLPRGGGVGFELLDKEKFGVSQFNEQINYQRALEGELARTIQRINSVKSARIHIAFPKSSLFLQQDKNKSSASVVLELQPGQTLDREQINAILHLVSSSISNLLVENITIVDQFGKLLNQTSLEYDQVNDSQFKYSKDIETRYKNRIKDILEPLVGVGNIYAEVTAQIDFNAQEKTQEKYSPNTNRKNQSIRSHQISIHDEIEKQTIKSDIPNALSNNNIYFNENKRNNKDLKKSNSIKNTQNSEDNNTPINSNINRDNTINYELNHSVSHTKMNIGEIKRLSVAVIVNFTEDKNGKLVPLTIEKTRNIEKLIREAIGYSKSRGDTIHLVNASFAKHNQKKPIQIHHLKTFEPSNFLFIIAPWFFCFLFVFFLLKKYICPFSKSNTFENALIMKDKKSVETNNILEKNITQVDIQKNVNVDKLIHQICNISNQNPRTIALIIRQWMSDKI